MRCNIRIMPLVSVVIALAIGFNLHAYMPERPTPVNELPEIKELANPFMFVDGEVVRTKDDWQRRRAELKRLFELYEYGGLPPKPESISLERGNRIVEEANGVAIENVLLKLQHYDKSLSIPMTMVLPFKIDGKIPVVIQGLFRGIPGRWEPPPPGERLKIFAERGYAVAEVDFQAVYADDRERAKSSGIYQLFGNDLECGGLIAWAWAMHRAINALETMDEIDSSKIVVTGHSRYGKTASGGRRVRRTDCAHRAKSLRLCRVRTVSFHLW